MRQYLQLQENVNNTGVDRIVAIRAIRNRNIMRLDDGVWVIGADTRRMRIKWMHDLYKTVGPRAKCKDILFQLQLLSPQRSVITDGKTVRKTEGAWLKEVFEYNSFFCSDGNTLIAFGIAMRFGHSLDPSAFVQLVYEGHPVGTPAGPGGIYLIFLRDVQVGEEVTLNYTQINEPNGDWQRDPSQMRWQCGRTRICQKLRSIQSSSMNMAVGGGGAVGGGAVSAGASGASGVSGASGASGASMHDRSDSNAADSSAMDILRSMTTSAPVNSAACMGNLGFFPSELSGDTMSTECDPTNASGASKDADDDYDMDALELDMMDFDDEEVDAAGKSDSRMMLRTENAHSLRDVLAQLEAWGKDLVDLCDENECVFDEGFSRLVLRAPPRNASLPGPGPTEREGVAGVGASACRAEEDRTTGVVVDINATEAWLYGVFDGGFSGLVVRGPPVNASLSGTSTSGDPPPPTGGTFGVVDGVTASACTPEEDRIRSIIADINATEAWLYSHYHLPFEDTVYECVLRITVYKKIFTQYLCGMAFRAPQHAGAGLAGLSSRHPPPPHERAAFGPGGGEDSEEGAAVTAGLFNRPEWNICYMNAALQMLRFSGCFEHMQILLPAVDEENGHPRLVATTIKKMFEDLAQGGNVMRHVNILRSEMGFIKSIYRGSEYQDAHDFLQDVLWCIYAYSVPASVTYIGTDMATRTSCAGRGCFGVQQPITTDSRQLMGITINMPQGNMPTSLQEALRNYMLPTEVEFDCALGNPAHTCSYTQMICSRTPDFLLIHVKRFICDAHGTRQSHGKNNANLDYPLHSLKFGTESDVGTYDLVSVVNHTNLGHDAHCVHSGHYITIAQDQRTKSFFVFDDDKVRRAQDADFCHSSAYIFLYRRQANAAVTGSR